VNKRPTVLNSSVGLFLCLWFPLGGCATQDTGAEGQNTRGSQSSASGAVASACAAYCNHVYGTATGCSEDVIETQGAGCHAFCNTLSQTVPEVCEEPIIAAYDCIVESAIPYTCTTEDGSPVPTDEACESMWAVAESCIGG
jgi:hypothetical protein